jgi:hypothetical protein
MYVVMMWLLGLMLIVTPQAHWPSVFVFCDRAATTQRQLSLVVSIPFYDLQVHNVAITVLVDAGIKVIRNSKMWPVELLRLEALSFSSNVCYHHPFKWDTSKPYSVNVDEAHTLLSSGHYCSVKFRG